jgi:hypothetical protein
VALPKIVRASLVLGALAALTGVVRRALSSRQGDARPDSEGIIR